MYPLKAIAVFALLTMRAFCVFGQNEEVGDSLAISLDEVVIQSSFFENQAEEFAGSISVINPATIQKSDALYLQTILNASPGVYMQSGALNTNRITIRGIGSRSPFSTNKIKAYLDDIPLSGGDGETTIEDIDLNTLKGIEIYRGPASTQFGAGLGGAIHLITDQFRPANAATADLMFGSFGLRKYNVLGDFGSSKKNFKLYYQNVSSDGYRENNQYQRQSFTGIARLKTSKKSDLSAYFNVTNLKAFIPSSINEETFENDPSAAAPNWQAAEGFEDNSRFRVGFSLNTEYNQKVESTIAIFLNGGNSREVTPIGSIGIEEVNFTNVGMRSKVKASFLDDKLQTVLGFELFLEGFEIQNYDNINSSNGALFSDFDQTRNYGNVFLSTEYKPTEKWTMEVGTNLNFSSFEAIDRLLNDGDDQSGAFGFDPIVSPKISVRRQLTNNISAYALVAHGFSLPTFDETLNPGGQINQDIKPESGYNYELGLKGNLSENIYFELAGYTMRIKNLLVAKRDDQGAFIGENAGKTTHNGLEILLKQQLLNRTGFQLDHRLAFTLMDYRFDEFIDDENGDFSGNELTGVPNFTMAYLIQFTTAIGFYGNINWQSTGSMPMRDDNSVYTDSYNVVNFKFGFEKTISGFDFNLYVGINNILDEKYASMILINARSFGGAPPRYYYPGLPINYFGGVKLGYRF